MIPLLAQAQPVTFVITDEVRIVGGVAFVVVCALGGLAIWFLSQQLGETKTMRVALMDVVGQLAGNTSTIETVVETVRGHSEDLRDHEGRIKTLEIHGAVRKAAGS